MNDSPIIIALDVDSADAARHLVSILGKRAGCYKVGLELYAVAGMHFVEQLADKGIDVFLDLKFYDISETVKRAVKQVATSGARFLSIHGSRPIVKAAVEGRADSELQLLAITVLTNFDDADVAELGYRFSIPELVALRVQHAREVGCDGVVCSPLEVGRVRDLAGPDAILVCPGVRSAGAPAGDQKRVATPAEALRNGANYIVVGRQVTRADDPVAELAKIEEEIAAARA
jgi:orotidine-5'-phosphate decarboxylase